MKHIIRISIFAVLILASFGCRQNNLSKPTVQQSGKETETTKQIAADKSKSKEQKNSHSGTKGSTNPGSGGDTGSAPSSNKSETGTEQSSTPQHPITNITVVKEMFSNLFAIKIEPKEHIPFIKAVSFNGKEGKACDRKIIIAKPGDYFIDAATGMLHTWPLKADDIITFKGDEGILGSFQYKGTSFEKMPAGTTGAKPLQVKLIGAFEAAVVNQKKYDGISGSSASISSNTNSNVTVLVTEKNDPADTDWMKIKQFPASLTKSKVIIKNRDGTDANMGMAGVFIKLSSALMLSGTPNKAGDYQIFVELHDNYGRTAVSNALPFSVYAVETPLSDVLKPGCANDKGLWDMTPWSIQQFGNNNSMTVPADVKHWFGSHKSGTYGLLGYPVGNEEQPTQTLIVQSELKLINMQVLSSVNIVVKSGGKLNLQDSSIHGIITVEEGGEFQMNYDDFRHQYGTGAQINGQLILKDGAILKDSLIYSNTNFLANGNQARHNEEPVVIATGNVSVRGKAYIRGDEAATGVSKKTGKLLTGQPAMSVKNGTLTIESGSELGVYGGGRIATTSEGGAGLILENGTVTGEGKLIAIGGSSASDNGANGVSAADGNNKLSVKEAFLQGGNTNRSSYHGGEPYTSSIDVAPTTIGVANKGTFGWEEPGQSQSVYWHNILHQPPVEKYTTSGKPPIKS